MKVAVYSIKDLEKLTGIKAHTLRAWEQRYNILNPKRTKSNIRYYEDKDLKLILNISLLNKNGLKISKIAKMSSEEILEKVRAISEINYEFGTQLDALTISMIEMDEQKFDRIINTNIQQIGFEQTMLEVIYPFLDKLSLLWLTGSISPVQENFISFLIRQKIIVAIDKEPSSTNTKAKKFLLYLPEGERQELSLLLMHYLVKSRGHKVVYIGQDINITDLQDAYNILKPDHIFTMITEAYAKEPVQKYIDQLSLCFPDCQLLFSGYQMVVQDITPNNNNYQILKSLDQALTFLNNI